MEYCLKGSGQFSGIDQKLDPRPCQVTATAVGWGWGFRAVAALGPQGPFSPSLGAHTCLPPLSPPWHQ